MNLGLLVLRVVVGALFAGHGGQKLFGWFGGPGLRGTGGFFQSLGLRPGRTMALGAGMAELGGGLLLGLGLLTPLAAALLSAVMFCAIWAVHRTKGLWVSDGGFEYNLVLIAAAFAITGIGAGRWSLDHALGIVHNGAGWALIALGVGLLGAILTLLVGRMSHVQHAHRTTPAGA